jgi:hypothetical protein
VAVIGKLGHGAEMKTMKKSTKQKRSLNQNNPISTKKQKLVK